MLQLGDTAIFPCIEPDGCFLINDSVHSVHFALITFVLKLNAKYLCMFKTIHAETM